MAELVVDSLAAIRAFVAVADTRSFKLAGQELGLSSSAVGKSVARLEEQLAATLFHRTTRRISLTEAGSIFLLRARHMLEELQAGEAELAEASSTPRGRLRVSLPLSGSLLTKALAGFVEAHPLVELDLDYSDRIVDVIDEGFDVVIRTGETGDSRLLHKKLGEFGWLLVASPAYIGRHGKPASPDDLEHHVCLRQKFSSGRIAPWSFRSMPGIDAPVSLTASVIDPLLDLTLRGAGIGCFPEFIVRDSLADKTLVKVLEGELDHIGVLTLLWPASRFRVPKVRAFVDYISERVGADVGG